MTELQRDDLGLSIDMRDVDQLRTLSNHMAAGDEFRGEAQWMWSLAERLEETVREIGTLRLRQSPLVSVLGPSSANNPVGS